MSSVDRSWLFKVSVESKSAQDNIDSLVASMQALKRAAAEVASISINVGGTGGGIGSTGGGRGGGGDFGSQVAESAGIGKASFFGSPAGQFGDLRQSAEGVKTANRSLLEFEREISTSLVERGAIFDRIGNKLAEFTSNSAKYVEIPEQYKSLMSGNVFTHNHPGTDTAFSFADIQNAAYYNPEEIRAVTREKTFSAQLSRNGFPIGDEYNQQILKSLLSTAAIWKSQEKGGPNAGTNLNEAYNNQVRKLLESIGVKFRESATLGRFESPSQEMYESFSGTQGGIGGGVGDENRALAISNPIYRGYSLGSNPDASGTNEYWSRKAGIAAGYGNMGVHGTAPIGGTEDLSVYMLQARQLEDAIKNARYSPNMPSSAHFPGGISGQQMSPGEVARASSRYRDLLESTLSEINPAWKGSFIQPGSGGTIGLGPPVGGGGGNWPPFGGGGGIPPQGMQPFGPNPEDSIRQIQSQIDSYNKVKDMSARLFALINQGNVGLNAQGASSFNRAGTGTPGDMFSAASRGGASPDLSAGKMLAEQQLREAQEEQRILEEALAVYHRVAAIQSEIDKTINARMQRRPNEALPGNEKLNFGQVLQPGYSNPEQIERRRAAMLEQAANDATRTQNPNLFRNPKVTEDEVNAVFGLTKEEQKAAIRQRWQENVKFAKEEMERATTPFTRTGLARPGAGGLPETSVSTGQMRADAEALWGKAATDSTDKATKGLDLLNSSLVRHIGNILLAVTVYRTFEMVTSTISETVDLMAKLEAVSARVGFVLGQSAQQAQSFTSNITKTGAAFGLAPSQQGDAAIRVAQATKDSVEQQRLATDAAKLATLSGQTYGQSVDDLVRIQRSFNLTVNDTGRILNTVATIYQQVPSTISEITNLLERLGPVAEATGLSMEQIGLLAAQAAQRSGASISTVVNVFTRAQENLGNNANQQKLEQYGIIPIDTQGQVRPFLQILTEVKTKLEELRQAGRDSEALDLASAIAGKRPESLRVFISMLDGMTSSMPKTASASKLLSDSMDTLDFKLKTLTSTWGLLQNKLGEIGGLQIARGAIDLLSASLQGYIKLIGDVQKNKLDIPALLGASGALINPQAMGKLFQQFFGGPTGPAGTGIDIGAPGSGAPTNGIPGGPVNIPQKESGASVKASQAQLDFYNKIFTPQFTAPVDLKNYSQQQFEAAKVASEKLVALEIEMWRKRLEVAGVSAEFEKQFLQELENKVKESYGLYNVAGKQQSVSGAANMFLQNQLGENQQTQFMRLGINPGQMGQFFALMQKFHTQLSAAGFQEQAVPTVLGVGKDRVSEILMQQLIYQQAASLALDELLKVEKGALNGVYNLPAGASAYVAYGGFNLDRATRTSMGNNTTTKLDTGPFGPATNKFDTSVDKFSAAVNAAARAGASPHMTRDDVMGSQIDKAIIAAQNSNRASGTAPYQTRDDTISIAIENAVNKAAAAAGSPAGGGYFVDPNKAWFGPGGLGNTPKMREGSADGAVKGELSGVQGAITALPPQFASAMSGTALSVRVLNQPGPVTLPVTVTNTNTSNLILDGQLIASSVMRIITNNLINSSRTIPGGTGALVP